ncbi:MAG: glycosyl transferase [Candidatus Edwardsbacteria bacterium RIFOXYD12_FULL_50_11]|uniref:Glycosyl transferase n=1 Tax=Candidatus Edwardsbacteria bacterium GWF2_54_11 TaxID=1817851 RepID=A0A1F5RHP8_9BACT|nr:MAG: glycosyl transferase [Candidatus Edwardsbacteria bacterium RifOxyC12_full_54_24]OGF07122.1 MAG: glycosyl transferase [Candidatus Edwardsbacteria bacterium RifOxyA12_full_54_48]OGF10912.1 MAG: glycosyl transferase [Candidatus Edwardsbacteria bacterium GWE2_54_12]OGF13551.1 MAG: glycosyl transferase [Candidatus Edwardsbacteria bacterium GWF2_54_11]OGF15858.1 MAG: glycosyl transferase [Candidatus Edwardsbacteria bacterium RIFOXYD12_FULL_50_11]OGJ17407.1 MAG: glycosyl transferase [Candidat
MKLSVIMPVYNEKATIEKIIARVLAVPIEKELVIVDDYSTDGTKDILKTYEGRPGIKISYHPYNLGKGAGIRTGIRECTGDIVIIQDADLEYSPEEYPRLVEPIVRGAADVVYGSRFYGTHRVFMVWHYLGNKFLTALTNVLYNTMLTDMETCYKVFRSEVIKDLNLRSFRFDIEPEITAKIFKNRKLRVYEMPITYDGRDYHEGKKIHWYDALPAIWTLIKYRFVN